MRLRTTQPGEEQHLEGSLDPADIPLGDPTRLHRALAHWNRSRLRAGRGEAPWREDLLRDARMHIIECRWLEQERAKVCERAAQAPTDADGFVAWFEALETGGPGQGDPLFPYLANEASRDELRWFVEQEVAGEAGFDDLVALTQVQLPTRAKLELARNYWDEMGRGREPGMHGPMLERLAQSLGASSRIETTVWESLALGNALVAMATQRRYAMHSVGALGAVELTAPGRAVQVVEALKRIGLKLDEYRYFALHAVLDVKHSAAWNREVLWSLVDADPRNAQPIAEGALIRLEAGASCFARYRRQFGIDLH